MGKTIRVSDKSYEIVRQAAEGSGVNIGEVADLFIGASEELREQVTEATKGHIRDLKSNPGVIEKVTTPVTLEIADLETEEFEEDKSETVSWGWALLVGLGLLYMRARQQAASQEPSHFLSM